MLRYGQTWNCWGIAGLVVESTYNWYWLVDALKEAGYRVHLANTAAIVQYSGLKYSDDDSDARWLAELLHRGLLAEGTIYPKEDRAVRDLLRRRSRLVQQHTASLLAIQNLFARDRGRSLSANEVKRLTPETVPRLLPDPNQALAVQATLLTMRGLEAAIDLLEREALAQVRLRPAYRHLLSVSGSGQVLGLTILLETGPIEGFAAAGHYASYCRCVGSERLSNGKRKGRGNTKNGNKYLAWAYIEAAHFAVRYNAAIELLPAQAGQEQRRDRHQDRRPQAGPGLLPHAARGYRLRRRQGLRLNHIGVVAATSPWGWPKSPQN